MPGLVHPGAGRATRATLPSPPPPGSWPARAAAAAPPHPLSGASLAPGQTQTVGMRMMLGDKRGKGEGVTSGPKYFGEHISSLPQAPSQRPQRGFPKGPSPTLELPTTNEMWVYDSGHRQLPPLLEFTTGPPKPLPVAQDGAELHHPPGKK